MACGEQVRICCRGPSEKPTWVHAQLIQTYHLTCPFTALPPCQKPCRVARTASRSGLYLRDAACVSSLRDKNCAPRVPGGLTHNHPAGLRVNCELSPNLAQASRAQTTCPPRASIKHGQGLVFRYLHSEGRVGDTLEPRAKYCSSTPGLRRPLNRLGLGPGKVVVNALSWFLF